MQARANWYTEQTKGEWNRPAELKADWHGAEKADQISEEQGCLDREVPGPRVAGPRSTS